MNGTPPPSPATPRRFDSIAALRAAVGDELGPSAWIEIGQDRIDGFAAATEDRQWIHVDPARAAAESPFGGTITHGYLTLSLIPHFLYQTFAFTPRRAGLNYGLERVRFLAPVPAGSRLRGRFALAEAKDEGEGRLRVVFDATIDLEGSPRPACIARIIALYLTG